ncbi:hypothetical protein [Luteolibacter marinus]|uniref:hypothetical protein n=1 Tax=Luteolibacter marinus TaxID=2776705 RepID=UPI00186920DA|nr:hypothetical protein [Luteolibacter marinus]
MRFEVYLVAAILFLSCTGTEARSRGYAYRQTITVNDVPAEVRIPGLAMFGERVSISGDWCAISEMDFWTLESQQHLFRWERGTSPGGGSWEWRQAVPGLGGEMHLHGSRLLVCRRDYGGLQEYRLVGGSWQESGLPISELQGRWNFEGEGASLVATQGGITNGPRQLWALDHRRREGWTAEPIAEVGGRLGLYCDREGRRVIVGGPYFGEVLREYRKGRAGWQRSRSLEVMPAWDGLRYFALWHGNVVSLKSFTDAFGNPIGIPSELSVLFPTGRSYREVFTKETRGLPWGIATTGGSILLYGAPTDVVGNPTRGQLEVYGAFLNPVPTPDLDAQVVASGGRWLVVSDSIADAFGNPVGGSVVMLRR